MLLFSGHRHSYFLEISILVLLVPSDADDGGGGDGGGGGDFPTTLPAWQGPRGYHGQGSNIPFGESLTLIKQKHNLFYPMFRITMGAFSHIQNMCFYGKLPKHVFLYTFIYKSLTLISLGWVYHSKCLYKSE